MDFDRDRVYTSLNADEVKIGSIGYYADSLEGLIQEFTQRVTPKKLAKVHGPHSQYRFEVDESQTSWNLFYLVEESVAPNQEDVCTYKEMAKWLMSGHGEYMFQESSVVYSHFSYELEEENKPVDADSYMIRKWDDTEWHAPTRKYMGIEE